nr:MAG TPA: hypothetical protein [Caudoviricetes sp.]
MLQARSFFVPHLGHGPSVTRPRAIKNKSNKTKPFIFMK